MNEPIDRRGFLLGAGASLAVPAFAARADGPELTHGPFVTRLEPPRVEVWARASEPGDYWFELISERTTERAVALAKATAESDLTLRWTLQFQNDQSEPADFAVSCSGKAVVPRRSGLFPVAWTERFRRARAQREQLHAPGEPAEREPLGPIVLGSCADERKFPDQPVWDRMRELRPELVVLLGDTPYIDSTELAVQRERYRAFYAQAQLAALLSECPFVGTWDDHDYSGNDQFGAVEGRERSRQAFLEYHGAGEWGEKDAGVYSSRRVGDIELFLLDTRWFADTAPSPFDETGKTLLGIPQWRWLQEGLRASTAPFKVIASGMIWNDAVRPGKVDHWGHWPHEREALFRFLRRKSIGGVVLVGGDIHRTRVVEHATADTAGYPIVELITSPIANTVIESAAVDHPGLLFDRGSETSFLRLDAAEREGTHVLTAEFIDGTGTRMFSLERTASYLRSKD